MPASIPPAPAISTANGPAEMLHRWPDIIAAERALASSNAQIGVAVAEHYPKFTLSSLLGMAVYRLAVLRASQDVENAFSTLINQKARSTALSQGETLLMNAAAALGSKCAGLAETRISSLQI